VLAFSRTRLVAVAAAAGAPFVDGLDRGQCGADGIFGDAEGEVQVPHPVAGEAHRDHARSFQPVRHFQAADVQRAQPEALDERLHVRLGLRIVASDEDPTQITVVPPSATSSIPFT
jgi:hypothetical protein